MKTRSRIFRSILASYLLILLLPLLASIASFFFINRSLLTQLDQVADVSSRQLRSVMDGYLESATNIGRSILNQDRMQHLSNEVLPFEKDNLYTASLILRDMRVHAANHEMIRSIALYYPQTNAVLTLSGLYYGESFSSICQRETGITYEDWMGLRDFNRYKQYVLIQSGQNKQLLALLSPAVASRDINARALVAVQFDMDKLTSAMEQISSKGQFQTLLFQAGKVLLQSHTGTDGYGTLLETSSAVNAAWFSSIYALQPSNVIPDAHYAFILPVHGYLSSIYRSIKIAVIFFVLLLFCSLFLAFYLARKNYTPLQRLAQTILSLNNDKQQHHEVRDEYNLLSTSLKALIEKEKHNETLLIRQAESLRSYALQRFLRGKIQTDQLWESLRGIRLTLSEGCVCVFATLVDDTQSTILDQSELADESLLELLTMMLQHSFEHTLPAGCIVYTTQINNLLVTLANIPHTLEANIFDAIDMKQIAESVRCLIEHQSSIPVSVALSDTLSGLQTAPLCYRQAREASEYITMFGLSKKVLTYAEMASDQDAPESSMSLMQEEARLLVSNIRSGNYETAGELVTRLFDTHFQEGNCTLWEAKLYMSEIISSILAAFESIRPHMDSDFYNSLDHVNKLCGADSIMHLRSDVQALLGQLIDYAQTQHASQRNERYQEIISYIRENLTDHSLTVASVSEHFDLSASYLSKIFKQATGMSPLDYIHQLRVNQAKILLISTRSSIKEIAEQTGYWNVLTMTRAFRRLEGMPPSLYRQTSQERISSHD